VAQLPIGASRRDFEQARDAALVPIRNAVATRQEQEMRVGLMQHVEFRFAGWPDDLRKQASAAMRDAINGKPAGTQWKRSTRKENEGRIGYHLTSVFAPRSLRSFSRDELQGLLDRKAALSLSFSVVDHLRWDLNQIFGMAVVEGYLQRNPAALLFTPRECPRATTRVMTVEEVRRLSVLGVRERLIAKLGVLAGMCPGEIFALTWGRLEAEYADIRQRVYRGGWIHRNRFDQPAGRLCLMGCSIRLKSGRSCRSGQAGIPFREGDRAGIQRQLLAAAFPAEIISSWFGLGELPGHAAHTQFANG